MRNDNKASLSYTFLPIILIRSCNIISYKKEKRLHKRSSNVDSSPEKGPDKEAHHESAWLPAREHHVSRLSLP